MLKSLSILIAFIFFSLNSQAWVELNWSQNFDPSARTHIILVGSGSYGIGFQFAQSALSQARKIREIFPQDQVLVITNEESDATQTSNKFKAWEPGAHVTIQGTEMNSLDVIARLTDFSKIASFFVFAHNAPLEGSALSEWDRFSPGIDSINNLKGHFTSDAFLIIEGCNSGFDVAKGFGEILGIPAMGSLTSTNFQRLHADGNYYSDDPGNYPSNNWKGTNNQSFKVPWKCPAGDCIRMKPDITPYAGEWGSFSGGLGFYKWFCASASATACEKAMQTYALLWVGPKNLSDDLSTRGIMNFINDYFCEQDKTGDRRRSCANKIAESLQTDDRYYNSFRGKTYQCDLNHCDVEIQCVDYSCAPTAGLFRTTTMMDEIKNYIRVLKKMMGLRN